MPTDYGISPGNDPDFSPFAARLIQRRDGTELRTGPRSVEALVNVLWPEPQRSTVGDLLLAAHAWMDGTFLIPMLTGQTGETIYETLLDILKNPTSNPLARISAFSNTNYVNLLGCNLGKSPKFLLKLKEVFGNRVGVTAPKHNQAIRDFGGGSLEYWRYEFRVRNDVPFEDRDAVVDAFVNDARFALYDGSMIGGNATGKRAWFEKNIPRSVAFGPKQANVKKATTKALPLGISIGKKSTFPIAETEFEVKRETITHIAAFADNAELDNALKSGLVSAFRTGLSSTDEYKPGYGFPYFERFGFENFNDFYASFNWSVQSSDVKRAKGPDDEAYIHGRATCYRYTMKVPIALVNPSTHQETDTLLFNHYYPKDGSGNDSPPDIVNVSWYDPAPSSLYANV